MTLDIVRTVCFAVFFLSAAAAASAEGHRACSNASLAGAWGYTETGTVIVPPPAGPATVLAAAVGRYDFDHAGNFSGTQNSSAGDTVSQDVKVGTYALNPDCTGTLTLGVWDPTGQTLRRKSVWAIVLVDNATEIRGMMTSMALPNGFALAPIMTMSARRVVSGDRGNQRDER